MSEYTLDDGRKAVKIENKIDPMTKVTEIYVEPKLQKKLNQRTTERFGVIERIVETLDEDTGEVVDKIVEKVCEGTYEKAKKSPIELVEEKLSSKFDLGKYFIIGFITIQVLILSYIVFLM